MNIFVLSWFDTFFTNPHPELRICTKHWQAMNFLVIKYDDYQGCQAEKGIYKGS